MRRKIGFFATYFLAFFLFCKNQQLSFEPKYFLIFSIKSWKIYVTLKSWKHVQMTDIADDEKWLTFAESLSDKTRSHRRRSLTRSRGQSLYLCSIWSSDFGE